MVHTLNLLSNVLQDPAEGGEDGGAEEASGNSAGSSISGPSASSSSSGPSAVEAAAGAEPVHAAAPAAHGAETAAGMAVAATHGPAESRA